MLAQSPAVAGSHAPTADTPDAATAYAPQRPRERAQQLLTESTKLLEHALEALKHGQDPAACGEEVGKASDLVGSALHFLRLATRA